MLKPQRLTKSNTNRYENDSIKLNRNYKIIDTSSLLVTDKDFTYNIEPSKRGGKKIVEAILNNI